MSTDNKSLEEIAKDLERRIQRRNADSKRELDDRNNKLALISKNWGLAQGSIEQAVEDVNSKMATAELKFTARGSRLPSSDTIAVVLSHSKESLAELEFRHIAGEVKIEGRAPRKDGARPLVIEKTASSGELSKAVVVDVLSTMLKHANTNF